MCRFQTELPSILDKVAPLKTGHRTAGTGPRKAKNYLAFTWGRCAKKRRRRLERRWKATNTEPDRLAYRAACSSAKKLILKLILRRTRSQCKSERTGVMWQNRGLCVTTRARVFWTSWRRVRFETDVPARRELQKSSWEPTIACCSYIVLEASVVREARIWCRTRI